MERELWPRLYQRLQSVAERFQQKYVQIPSWILVATMLWAAIHDRPISWACREKNWETTKHRPPRLPSSATMSRRIDGLATGLLFRALEQDLRTLGQNDLANRLVAYIDGKPMRVGYNSKDPDAAWGHVPSGFAKGYKLHAIWTEDVTPDAWEVTPLNVGEKTVAARLIPLQTGCGYLIADGEYDSGRLYDLAHRHGRQLVSPCRKAKNPGGGHRPQNPHRLHAISMLKRPFGKGLYKMRAQIERNFGNVTSFGGGLAPLPAWVRGLDRVRTWTWAKLLINAVRILRNQDLRHP